MIHEVGNSMLWTFSMTAANLFNIIQPIPGTAAGYYLVPGISVFHKKREQILCSLECLVIL